MEQSTQWGVSIPNTFPMEKHLKSKNRVLNIPRRHEPVATDTVFSDTPAVDSGVKQAQVFVGRDTLVADAEPVYLYSLFYFYMFLVIASLANSHMHAFPIQGTIYILSHNIII